ncbi:hypothetical protein ABZ307_08075 [Streptomyces griseorubiginosus]|uniref:hypothetical protein n=1 Tax=Streptomyces griseorubiginosus TaxID=67304 RepID=UPI00339DCB26
MELGYLEPPFRGHVPGEPVVLATRTDNDRSLRLARRLGFVEVGRFEEFGGEQWYGVWSSNTATAPTV